VRTGEKSNELTIIPELLEMLEVQGDNDNHRAMGCQMDRAAKIRKKEGDYVLSVKENRWAVPGWG
jgi:predicted transposase YbfD/YdcC